MAFKPRWKSDELKILGFLNTHMSLAEIEKQYYLNLKKGFEGEMMFDLLTEKLQSDCLILNDLLLKVNNTTFQIDTLIIQETLQLFEVKNYEGDYYYESEKFYSKSATEILNPLDQSKRCECLLRQLLQKHGYNFPIEARVVFINPVFTLYQAPKNKPIIYPTQLDRLMKNLDMTPSKLNGRHKKLADLLVSLHIGKSAYSQLPTYNYDHLKKGMTCGVCNSFSISVGGKKLVCDACGCEEDVESAVMRSVGEFKLLFPDRKVTTNGVHEWCRVVDNKIRISRILKKNLKGIGYGQWSYYE
jgi:hypothetical protein